MSSVINMCDCKRNPECECICEKDEDILPHAYVQQYNVDRTMVESHLNTLRRETYTIMEWENSIARSAEEIVTFPKYLALKLTRQIIIKYMAAYGDCTCCSRHTTRVDLPDLPKYAPGDDQHDEPTACYCSCRHNIRRLNEALVIVL